MIPSDDGRSPLLRNRLKERLSEGRLSLCLRVTWAWNYQVALVAQAAGFDALYVDLEHSTATTADAAQVCSLATALGVTPLVRIGSLDDDAGAKLLDAGCQGVIAPQVETADDARRLVDRSLLRPLGRRSAAVAPPLVDVDSGIAPARLAERRNAATLLCAMVESPEAVARAGEIAGVPGVDLLLVGSQDLTAALGVPGEVDHPAVDDAYRRVAAACAAAGAAFGVAGVQDPAVLARCVRLGARFLTAGSDVDLLRAAARHRISTLRALSPEG